MFQIYTQIATPPFRIDKQTFSLPSAAVMKCLPSDEKLPPVMLPVCPLRVVINSWCVYWVTTAFFVIFACFLGGGGFLVTWGSLRFGLPVNRRRFQMDYSNKHASHLFQITDLMYTFAWKMLPTCSGITTSLFVTKNQQIIWGNFVKFHTAIQYCKYYSFFQLSTLICLNALYFPSQMI